MSADLNTVLERLDSLEARVNSRFDTQGEQIKELCVQFKELVHIVNDRFDTLEAQINSRE